MALKEIKDSLLYRSKYTAWKDYLKAEWDLGRRIADYQIEAYSVVKNIEDKWHHGATFDLILPVNERQARPLTLLPPIQQITAWQKVLNRSESKPTSLIVRKVVEEILGKNDGEILEELKVEAATKEGIPEDFNEAFSLMANVGAKYKQSGWKNIKRKNALELINSLMDYFQ